jgi:hypothetical protein
VIQYAHPVTCDLDLVLILIKVRNALPPRPDLDCLNRSGARNSGGQWILTCVRSLGSFRSTIELHPPGGHFTQVLQGSANACTGRLAQ